MPLDRRRHMPDTLDTQSQSVRRTFDPGIPPPTQFSTSLPVICAVEADFDLRSHLLSRLLNVMRDDYERSFWCSITSGGDSLEEELERLKFDIEVCFMLLLLS